MLGLFAYFYVVLHLLSYSWFDMGFDVPEIAKDIAKRPFILVGFAAFVLLTPLAATSFNRAIKAMGAKRWQTLHKLVYVIAGLGILHFFWMRAGKNNFAEVFVYAAIIARAAGLARAGSFAKQKAAAARAEPCADSCRAATARLSASTSARCASGRRRFRARGSAWRCSPSTSTSAARPRVL